MVTVVGVEVVVVVVVVVLVFEVVVEVGVVVSVGSSGPPGGVGRRARRLERTWPREPGTGSGSRGARFPRIGLRSRSLAVMVPDFLPACCSARTFQIKIQSVRTFPQEHIC